LRYQWGRTVVSTAKTLAPPSFHETLLNCAVNYLAHAYLSFGIADIAVGNMISDFVKGKKKLDYPLTIGHGIDVHRSIDSFTDLHSVTKEAKTWFRADYGLYAGPLIDIVFDHFLATDPSQFPEAGSLNAFAQKTYQQLAGRQSFFPERFARMFPYMQQQNWLHGYQFREGIFNSFHGLARRAAHMPDPLSAFHIFETQYEDLKACYYRFFPDLKNFVRTELQRLGYLPE
jgi:acyl carrier protein phosphodiesterase